MEELESDVFPHLGSPETPCGIRACTEMDLVFIGLPAGGTAGVVVFGVVPVDRAPAGNINCQAIGGPVNFINGFRCPGKGAHGP